MPRNGKPTHTAYNQPARDALHLTFRETGLQPIKLLILDVDGVLTRGFLPYDAKGNEVKEFYVQDGGAIRRWQKEGNLAAIISGRASPAVETRAKDLGITLVYQKVWDKMPVYESLRKD